MRGNFQFAEYNNGQAPNSSQSARDNLDLQLDLQNRIVLPNGRPIAAIDQANKFIDADGRVSSAVPYSDLNADSALWFPLLEGAVGAGTFNDNIGQLSGNIAGTAYGKRYAGPDIRPGVTFNGSDNRIPLTGGSQNGFSGAARRIGDLKSLTAGVDMVVIWAMIGHPVSIPGDSTIIGWGCEADAALKGGWALAVKNASGKLVFSYTPKGTGATVLRTTMGMEGARGHNNDNRRTAIALEIIRSYTSAYLELRGYQLTMYTDGGVSQSNFGTDTVSELASGTGKVDYDTTAPFTIGAHCNTSGANFTRFCGAGMNIWNVGAIRKPIDCGIGGRICRDLRENMFAFPKSAR